MKDHEGDRAVVGRQGREGQEGCCGRPVKMGV